MKVGKTGTILNIVVNQAYSMYSKKPHYTTTVRVLTLMTAIMTGRCQKRSHSMAPNVWGLWRSSLPMSWVSMIFDFRFVTWPITYKFLVTLETFHPSLKRAGRLLTEIDRRWELMNMSSDQLVRSILMVVRLVKTRQWWNRCLREESDCFANWLRKVGPQGGKLSNFKREHVMYEVLEVCLEDRLLRIHSRNGYMLDFLLRAGRHTA